MNILEKCKNILKDVRWDFFFNNPASSTFQSEKQKHSCELFPASKLNNLWLYENIFQKITFKVAELKVKVQPLFFALWI